jgi:hemerythrin superfamily protein
MRGIAMNAFDLLKRDHQAVSQLFEKLASLGPKAHKTRENLFERLKDDLQVHAEIEERIFYPALQEQDETRDLAVKALEEHRQVKQALKDMEALSPGDEQWTARLTALQKSVQHHVREEEEKIFKSARQVLGEDRIKQMGQQLQKEKQALTATA